MAMRTIRTVGESVLTKKCRPVTKMTARLEDLITDMAETMYDAYGVGLAAPQVGVLRRIVVIDCSEERDELLIMVNPEILETEGSQTGDEGCLSLPGKCGTVTRPMKVKARALDMDMQPFEIEAEGLLARAICHELDHLDGIMYTEHVEGDLRDVGAEDDEDEDEETEE